MNQIPQNLKPFHHTGDTMMDKIKELETLVDDLGEQLDWNLTVDYQIIEQDKQTLLYAITIIAGEISDEEAPILLSTATVDEAIIRLAAMLRVMKELNIEALSRSQEHYQECLERLDQYFNGQCDDMIEQESLLSFFNFNDSLANED